MTKLCDECETVAHCLKHGCIPKQTALDKKAENARELGLDYEPVPENFIDALKFDVAMRDAAPVQPQVRTGDCLLVGVCASEGHKIQAQRQWVGLTDEEIEKACVPLGAAMLSFTEVARAIEAKLKERNT